MSFEVIGTTIDLKSGTHVIYCQASLDKYLDIVGEDFGEFSLQRKRESHKAYKRLREDIVGGALLPSITLSVKHHLVEDIICHIDDNKALTDLLSRDDVVDILDGLQRTYIISDLKRNGVVFKEGQKLLLEYWLEPDLSKLIYRMIVLNSGQKAMSMRHQIELLFLSLQETISSRLEGIEIIKEKDSKRRTQVKKYHLSSIVASYNAFITASHETDKENLVAQKLIDDGAFDSSEDELTAQFEDYMFYLGIFIKLDEMCWNLYTANQLDENGEEIDLGDSQNWLGSENVIVSIFSAIAQFLKTEKKARVDEAFDKLFKIIEAGEQDPLGLNVFNQVKIGLIYKKANMGFVTRKLIHTGFKEYFRDCGDTSLADCWPQAAE
ncbi:hypothetical protein KOL70_06235 [Pantoea sp. B270]|uniref:hypothetical protein n=1 Tax=Pantoea sp. B270 TaxID=2836826 RepID=UPI001BFF5AAE|nr:hypothetical protein [Pantoea sp. B270]MBU6517601.1 hypothetical protein [Pantoea sp. B270]